MFLYSRSDWVYRFILSVIENCLTRGRKLILDRKHEFRNVNAKLTDRQTYRQGDSLTDREPDS